MQKDALESICCIAQNTASAIMAIYQTDIEVMRKDDGSPVTSADIAANDIIVDALQKLAPEIPIISEESAPHVLPADAQRFWLVDPLDGTRSFIRHEDEFTVNIALIEANEPVMGVIVVPAMQQLYAGSQKQGAWRCYNKSERETIKVRVPNETALEVMVSHHQLDLHTQAFLKDMPVRSHMQAASSLKFCRIAEGAADLYPRFGPTMQWDTAAGHAIVNAAGGSVSTPEGNDFTYGGPDFRNGPFVVRGG